MIEANQTQIEPIKIYRPWVGVILSFLISGASQFLAGQRFQGVVWFATLSVFSFVCLLCLASPTVPGDFPAFALWIISVVLWITMIVKSYRPIPRFRWYGWMFFVFLALVLSEVTFYGFRSFVRPFKMPTSSMSPTIQGNTRRADGTTLGGDRIFVEGYAYWFSKPQRGDIVVFETKAIAEEQRTQFHLPSDEFYIKRVVGLPGDVLSIRNGQLNNHGQALTQPPILAKLVFPDRQYAIQTYLIDSNANFTVPDDSYFVVGDNTTNSLDSRFWGTIPQKGIIGRVSKIWWPLYRAGKVD